MGKIFYSPFEILKKPHVVPSLVTSIVIVCVIITFVSLLLKQNMINFSPIAEVEEIELVPRESINVQEVVNRDTVSAEIGKRSVFSGYFANMRDICSLYESDKRTNELLQSILLVKPIIVTIRTNNAETIGTITFGEKTCELVKKLEDTQVYAVFPRQYKWLYYEALHKYFTVVALKE